VRRRTPALLGSTLLCVSLLLTACASDDDGTTGANPPPAAGTSPTSPPPASPTASESVDLDKALADALAKYALATPPANTPKVSGEVGQKPTVAKPAGTEPTKLVIKDLVVGKGPVAPVNSTVTVDYHGVRWDNGEVFDSSFGKQPAEFPLANLIPGWQIGIPGMKEGGRRELVVPAELAYGPAGGSGGELAGKTLVFVIDLKKVGA
jgi:peptidylprolyl isomerase